MRASVAAIALAIAAMAGATGTASADTRRPVIRTDASVTYKFTTLDNVNETTTPDPNFNQLLGINNHDIIAGYDGDGAVLPNKGFVLVPSNHYSSENFPNSTQTQVIGINSLLDPVTVGFFIDTNGNNFGFTDITGTFVKVQNPLTGTSGGIKTNQLLGVNDKNIAVGFYNDAKGNSHGYSYDIGKKEFIAVIFSETGLTSFQATGINNDGVIVGFAVVNGVTIGFFGKNGAYTPVSFTGFSSVVLLGINNKGIAVGTITANGVSEGVVFDTTTNSGGVVNDPLSTTKAAFGVNGTTINGINDAGDLVGFFSDGKKVHGFLAVPG